MNGIPKNIQEDIIDIGYELTDLGFFITYKWSDVGYPKYHPCITIYKWIRDDDISQVSSYKYSNIEDYVERVNVYLDTKGYNTKVSEYTENVGEIKHNSYKIEIINRTIYNIHEMKHMKHLKEFYPVEKNIIEDVEDIFLELADEGYSMEFLNIPMSGQRANQCWLEICKPTIKDDWDSDLNTINIIDPSPFTMAQYLNSSDRWEQYICIEPILHEVIKRIEEYLSKCGFSVETEYDKFTIIMFIGRKEMKHLEKFNWFRKDKKFNETALPTNILHTLRDICLELEDIGLDVDIGAEGVLSIWDNHPGSRGIQQQLDRNILIKEILERIEIYMAYEGYNVKINQSGLHAFVYFRPVQYERPYLSNDVKHLKKFNEALDNILCDINDICLELEDAGYKIFTHKRNMDRYSILINTPEKEPLYLGSKETPPIIKEIIGRLTTYMKSKGFTLVDYYNTFTFQIEIVFDRDIKSRSYGWPLRAKYESCNREDIDDILLELKDLDLNIYNNNGLIAIYPNRVRNIREVIARSGAGEIEKKYLINWPDVKDCMLRLKDYLGDKFISFSYKGRRDLQPYKIVLDESTEINVPIRDVYITFKP